MKRMSIFKYRFLPSNSGHLKIASDIGLRIVRSIVGVLPARGTFSSYLIAMVLVSFALLARLIFATIDAGYQYITFFPAVAVAAIIGGIGPGLFAAICAVVFAQYFLTYPYGEFSTDSLKSNFWSVAIFLVDGIIVCSSIEVMHRFRSRAMEDLNEVHRQNDQILQLQQETELLALRSQSLMENSQDGICIMNLHGNIVMANDAFCRMLGYTQDEILKLNIADLNAQLPADELREIIKTLIGKSVLIETLHRRKDGVIINVEISASCVLTGEEG